MCALVYCPSEGYILTFFTCLPPAVGKGADPPPPLPAATLQKVDVETRLGIAVVVIFSGKCW